MGKIDYRKPTRRRASGDDRAAEQRWRQLACTLMESEQQDRCRLAERLHGELQQLLTVALMRTWAAKHLTGDDKLRSVLEEVAAVVHHSIDETRSLTLELSPPILRHSSLAKGFEWLAERMQDLYDVQVELNSPAELQSVPDQLKLFLFDSARELLLYRLAKGVRRARLSLGRNPKQLAVVLSDAGAGGEPSPPRKANGRLGEADLLGLAERVAAIGGSLTIELDDPTAFRAELVVPIDALAPAKPKRRGRFARTPEAPCVCEPIEAPAGVVRILLAEDHRMVREGLTRLINSEPDLRVIAEAADGDTAIELASRLNPDVVVLDVNMPIRSGPEAARIIRQHAANVHIIGLSEYGDAVTERAMRDAGARAYLCKDSAVEELCRAIRRLVGGNGRPANQAAPVEKPAPSNGRRKARANPANS